MRCFRDNASRLLLAAALLAAGPAAAQDFPGSIEAGPLGAWLVESTNIVPATVVSVTPELVVAIVGKTMPATPGGPVRLTLREEVIAPGYIDAVGGRSSLMSMEIHCEERRVRMDERRLYAGLNLTGAVEITEPSAQWVRIPEGSILDEVARATCDADYAWPLRSAGAEAASASIEMAALETPQVILPPGPDAKPVGEPAEIAAAETVNVPGAEAALPPATPAEAAPEAEPAAPVREEGDAGSEAAAGAETAAESASAPTPDQSAAAADPQAPGSPDEEPAAPAETSMAELSAPAAAAPPAEAPQGFAEAAPESIAPAAPEAAPPPAGPVFAVQIGAYESREIAAAAWAAFSAKRPVLADGLGFDIRRVRVKGRDWHRGLVRPFATRRDAQAFCTALAGTEYGCILRTLTD